MDGYDSSTYGDAFADVYDDWYDQVSPADETARFLAQRVDRGPIVEFGSGTGRLAAAIAPHRRVVGLDASVAMLRRSQAQVPAVPVVVADMAEPPVRDDVAGAVLVAFNTLFNLPTRALRRRALRDAGRLCRADGVVVVEAFVPGAGADAASDRVDVVRLDAASVVLRVSRTIPGDGGGTISGHHVELRDGEPVRLRPWHLAFCPPDVLDDDARRGGLVLAERWADWSGTAFDDGSGTHVSVYRPDRSHR